MLLYAAPPLICLHFAYVADVDLGWHLSSAEWIIEHRTFPHTDPFSRGAMGHPWQAYSWLYELLLLKLYQRWHLVGVVSYTAGMALAITVAVHRLLASLEMDVTKAIVLTMGVMLCICRLYTPRPWLFTVFFFVLEMNVLLAARRSGHARSLLWLPVLFAVWANVHIQFLDGLLVLGIAALESTAERWRRATETRLAAPYAWAALAGCVLSAMVNPYGWRIYKVAYDLASQRGVMGYITELQAIPFRGFNDFLLLFMALSAAGTLAWRRKLPLFETLLLVLAALVSFRSQRDVWLMAVVAGVVLATGVGERRKELVPSPHTDRSSGLLACLRASLLIAGACLMVRLGAATMRIGNPRLVEALASEMPLKAAEVIKARGYHGALYNTYDWGGFLLWTLHEPVSIDGRAALHGDPGIERSKTTWFGEPDWKSDPLFVSAGMVVAPVKMPLTQLLRQDPEFTLAYEDRVAAVFLRKQVTTP